VLPTDFHVSHLRLEDHQLPTCRSCLVLADRIRRLLRNHVDDALGEPRKGPPAGDGQRARRGRSSRDNLRPRAPSRRLRRGVGR
jgi:hypothetical protein